MCNSKSLFDFDFSSTKIKTDCVDKYVYISYGDLGSTAKLPMEFSVNTLFPFIEKYTLLRVAVPYL